MHAHDSGLDWRGSLFDHQNPGDWFPFRISKTIESWHKMVKRECIRPLTPLNLNDARRIVRGFVQTYNTQRLHSGIGYVTPQDRLGLDGEIMVERRRKLATARQTRQMARRQPQAEEQRPILVVPS
jgi:hypothetical protein